MTTETREDDTTKPARATIGSILWNMVINKLGKKSISQFLSKKKKNNKSGKNDSTRVGETKNLKK